MQLMTKELLKQLEKTGRQEHENIDDTLVLAHFFNPAGAGDWFITEYEPSDRILYGYASLFNDYNNEWGDMSLDELEEFKGLGGLGIERELNWTPKTIKEACKEKGIYYQENERE